MGKNLNYGQLVTRPKKLAFYQTPDGIYRRMEGFTDLSYSQNPKEYSRQYVDEEFERTDIVGYAPSISYSFDRYTGNEVLKDIVNITENELIGDQMKRTIVTVDLAASGAANARKRDYSVIPDSSGDSTDCLTYSGNFKTKGTLVKCTAHSNDDWQTVTVTEYVDISSDASITISGEGFETINIPNTLPSYSGEVPKNSFITININATFAGASVVLQKVVGSNLTTIAAGTGTLTSTHNQITTDTTYYVSVQNGGHYTNYTIKLTASETNSVNYLMDSEEE